jgi:two-component system chemotaxis response regulator CheB
MQNPQPIKIRVLVVDDSSVMRRIISTALNKNAMIEVVGYAANGLQAIDRVRDLQPDVVTLDIEMPELDGLGALREIRKYNQSVPIIMFSNLTHRGAQATVTALTAGATDYVCKPVAASGSMDQAFLVLELELIPKVIGLAQRALRRTTKGLASTPAPTASPSVAALDFPAPKQTQKPEPLAVWQPSQIPSSHTTAAVAAVVIGVSTGGPMALKEVFNALKAPLPVPVFIVQHMPESFTTLLADRLTAGGVTRFKEPGHGEVPTAGVAYIAPGGQHLVLSGNTMHVQMQLSSAEPQNSCRPSVDVLFQSASLVYGAYVLAVVMTGMGSDGLIGCQHIKARSGQIIAQDEESSVVWGMPGAAVHQGLADMVLPLGKIADELVFRTRRRS